MKKGIFDVCQVPPDATAWKMEKQKQWTKLPRNGFHMAISLTNHAGFPVIYRDEDGCLVWVVAVFGEYEDALKYATSQNTGNVKPK